MTKSNLALVGVYLFVALPAAAHDLWIEPSAFRPAPGTDVTITLRVGQKLQGESLPRDPLLTERFVLQGDGAETPVQGEPGDDPAGTVRVVEPGPQWIGYQSYPYPVVLEAAKFEPYLEEEGLQRIVEERAKKGQSATAGRERFYRCAKSLLDVAGRGSASGKPGAWNTPLGFTLELVPLKSPYALAAGDDLPVSVLFRGKPISGLLVVAINKNAPDRPVTARSDAKGLVRLRLARAGFWLVKAVHMQAAPPDAGVDWESWWASVTLDLGSVPKK